MLIRRLIQLIHSTLAAHARLGDDDNGRKDVLLLANQTTGRTSPPFVTSVAARVDRVAAATIVVTLVQKLGGCVYSYAKI